MRHAFLIDIVSGDEGAAAKAREPDEVNSLVAISVIMVHEYLKGIYYLYWDRKELRDKLRKHA